MPGVCLMVGKSSKSQCVFIEVESESECESECESENECVTCREFERPRGGRLCSNDRTVTRRRVSFVVFDRPIAISTTNSRHQREGATLSALFFKEVVILQVQTKFRMDGRGLSGSSVLRRRKHIDACVHGRLAWLCRRWRDKVSSWFLSLHGGARNRPHNRVPGCDEAITCPQVAGPA